MRLRKKISISIAAFLSIFILLTACSANRANGKIKSKARTKDKTSMIRTSDEQTQIIRYHTVYHNKRYRKQAVVYLPPNYRSKQKHNVLYLLHGSTEVRNGRSTLYSDGDFRRVLNELNNRGELEKTIVVFPTYYPSSKQISSNYYDDNPLNKRFAKTELMHDLVPAVEKHYRTYAKNASKKSLKRSRNHRAFGGFSMGSITTWYVLQYDLPYFRYFVPMASDSWTVTSDGGSVAPRRTAKVLAQAVQRHPKLRFKIMAGVGSGDGTSASMTPQIRAMWNLSPFNQRNLEYYTQPGGGHDAPTMARIINHYGSELFK